MTSAQNAGRMEAMHHAQEMGIKVQKKWLATLDSRTRDAHALLDGQVQDVDKPFQSQLGPIMFPGDPAADPGNVYNCRCALLWVYPEYSSENAKRRDNETGKLIEAMPYSEWKIFKQQPNDDQEWNNAQAKRIDSVIKPLEKQLDGWNDKTFSSYAAIFSEYTKIEDRINALYKKRAELKYPDDDVMGSIKHIAEKHTVQQDIVNTNPNYRKGPEWWNNCQRCIPTYEMRRRGYAVEALPKILTGKDETADKWQKIFDGAVWIDCDKGSGIQEVTKLMKDWGTGARAEVYIKYKRRNSAHVFVAENEEGNVVFRDPQSGQTVKAPWQALASPGHTKICRIDNLKPSKLVLGCMKEAK